VLLIITNLILVIALVAITYEDLRYREVHIWYFALVLLIFGFHFYTEGVPFHYLIINFSFLLVQVVGIILYMVVKHRSFTPLNSFIGAGDILMWGLFVFAFSPLNFIIFFVLSLLLALLLHHGLSRRYNETLPLAGWQSLSYLLMMLTSSINSSIDFFNDEFILNLLFYGVR